MTNKIDNLDEVIDRITEKVAERLQKMGVASPAMTSAVASGIAACMLSPDKCTNCGLCDKVCPSRLPVMTKLSITSPECLGCGDCVSSCPVKNTLTLGVPERSFSAKRLAMLIILFFLIGYSAARVGGVWGSGLSDGEYRHHIQNMDSEDYGHPGR